MSYILDALKKADQDRMAGGVPDLESVHEQEQPVRRRYHWIWILAALLLFNGVLIALLATRDHDMIEEMAAEKPVADSVKRVDDKSLPPVLVPRPVSRDTGVTRSSQPPVQPPRVRSAAVSPGYRPDTAAPVPQPARISKPAVPVAPPPASPPVRSAGTGAIPDWEDLSLEFRSGFEIPRLDVHVYDSDPQRRFILVNLQKYREGERLESGAVIEKILPDGIQLSYQGKRFRYRK